MEVKLIDVMGDDLRVCNAARVSFAKESEWFYIKEDGDIGFDTKILSEADQKLIKYLAKHNHFTPFTHVQITLREKVPIFVARQRFKHTVGFTYNEVSRRYVSDTPEFFIPDTWRKRADNIKQGSSNEVITEVDFTGSQSPVNIYDTYRYLLEVCEQTYEAMIRSGVAPEQARMVLPQSMYTEFYSTGSLIAYSRMINLRKDGHAQKEIQYLAQLCDEKIRSIPNLKHSWEALVGEKWY